MSTKYSISAASRIAGKGRATIRRHLKDGTLSCDTNAAGNRVIEASELIRVYGDECDFDKANETRSTEAPRSEKSNPEEVDELKRLYEARIKQYEATVERLEKELDQAHERDRETQEGYKQSLRLIEDHSTKAASSAEWKSALAEMDNKLANHKERSSEELASLEEQNKRKLARIRQELEAEREKSLWKKLFGRDA